MARSTTIKLARALAVAALALGAGCGDRAGSCTEQPDVTGDWLLTFNPLALDGGTDGATLPRATKVQANVEQVFPGGLLNLGRLLFGTLNAEDPGFFGTLEIPRLAMNNGSKTGVVLGCDLQVNIPIATPVSDDNQDQGPLRLALGGRIVAPRMMLGDPALSSLILVEDPNAQVRRFSWTGVQQ